MTPVLKISRRAFSALSPPDEWRVPVLVALGVLVGTGLVILRLSNAVSYLSDDARTCVNCHVMSPQFATWQHSSHARVAGCADCHVPQGNPFWKYAFKASDGIRHAYVFTFRLEPQVIRIKDAGMQAVQENCIRCHEPTLGMVTVGEVTLEGPRHGRGHLCWDCHRETPHGRVNSLASAPHARVPQLTPAVPDWISEYLGGRQQ